MTEQETFVVDGRKATDLVRTVMGIGGLVALVIGALILINPVESGAVMMKFIAILFRDLHDCRGSGVSWLDGLLEDHVRLAPSGQRVARSALFDRRHYRLRQSQCDCRGAHRSAFIFIGIMWIIEGIIAFASAKREARARPGASSTASSVSLRASC